MAGGLLSGESYQNQSLCPIKAGLWNGVSLCLEVDGRHCFNIAYLEPSACLAAREKENFVVITA